MLFQLTYKKIDNDPDAAHNNNLSVDLCENGRLDEEIAN